MNYKELNDNELISLSCENNEEATNLLIMKYKNIIISVLKDYQKKYNIYGLELSDLYQEGLIGLLTAIETFDANKDILFYTYASVCIRTSIMSAVRKTFTPKNRILNNSFSLDKLDENTASSLYEIIKDEKSDPSNILLNEEYRNGIIESIKSLLSKAELVIFDLKMKGLSNKEISSLLNKDKRYVENAISRINKKYKLSIKN